MQTTPNANVFPILASKIDTKTLATADEWQTLRTAEAQWQLIHRTVPRSDIEIVEARQARAKAHRERVLAGEASLPADFDRELRAGMEVVADAEEQIAKPHLPAIKKILLAWASAAERIADEVEAQESATATAWNLEPLPSRVAALIRAGAASARRRGEALTPRGGIAGGLAPFIELAP